MIQEALSEGLSPAVLDVINESALHAGHAGHTEAGGGNETHFKLNIESEHFRGMNQVARQRKVYELLAEVFKDGVHSVTMTTKIPG
ncbi:MAG: BolA family transcriptional regulator [Rhodospirillales bacterium]|nr:BolA family transcriptional regulator [Rhodospirillales bacterium]